MRRFILQQNIARFQRHLAEERDERLCALLRDLILGARRELALLEASASGAVLAPAPRVAAASRDAGAITEMRDLFESSRNAYLLLDPRPGLRIVDINGAYAQATMTASADVSGRALFEVFPDNPDDPAADGVSNLYASLQWAATHARPHAMAIQRYDVRDETGQFVERYWRPVNTPVLDDVGRVVYLLHHVEDVTEMMAARAGVRAKRAS